MKKLLLTSAILLTSLGANAQSALSIALQQENTCMVRRVYEKLPTGEPIQKLREYAVDTCINFSQGIGAWYLKDKRIKDKEFDPSSDTALAALVRFKIAGIGYLERQLTPRCIRDRLNLEACLETLDLPI